MAVNAFPTALATAALIAALAGCGADPYENGPGTSAEPKTLKAATKAAQEAADRFSSGDYSGEWDMFTPKFQKRVSRKDWVKWSRACKTSGFPIEVHGIRIEGNVAVVRSEVLSFKTSSEMLYVDGHWRTRPDPDTLAAIKKEPDVDKRIAAGKKAGYCD